MMRLTSLFLSTIVLSTSGADMEMVAQTRVEQAEEAEQLTCEGSGYQCSEGHVPKPANPECPVSECTDFICCDIEATAAVGEDPTAAPGGDEARGDGDEAPLADGDDAPTAAMQGFKGFKAQAENMIAEVNKSREDNKEILKGLHQDCQMRINASHEVNAQLLEDNIRRDLTIVEKIAHNGRVMSEINQSLTEHESTRKVLASLESRLQLAIQFTGQSYELMDLSKVKDVDIGRLAYEAEHAAPEFRPSNATEFLEALTAMENSSPGNEGETGLMQLSLLQQENDAVRSLLVDPASDMFKELRDTLENIKEELQKAKMQLEAECDERLANLTKTNENLADDAQMLDTKNASVMETGRLLALAHSHVTNTTALIARRVNALLDFFVRTKQSLQDSMEEADALESEPDALEAESEALAAETEGLIQNGKAEELIRNGHGANGVAGPESSMVHPSTWFGFGEKSV